MSIRDYFSGKTVAITGATGFVGQCLIEKLLRSCPEIKCIYALIRNNKSQTADERLDKLLKLPIFESLEEDDLKKVVAVASDLGLHQLGISDEQNKILVNQIQIFFHCAATLRFNEPLKVAFQINTLAVKNIVKLCRQTKNLETLAHVSTAYSYCERDEIGEQVYPTGWNADKLYQSIRWMKDDMIEKLLPEILAKRPNTYTLTKAFAEEVLVKEAGDLPVCIIRPSIIGATYQEPIPGWCANLNGATGIFVGYGKGLLHTLHAHSNNRLDVIPVDFVVNAIISAAYKSGSNHLMMNVVGKSKDEYKLMNTGCDGGGDDVTMTTMMVESEEVRASEESEEMSKRRKSIPVYNLVTGTDNPLTLNQWNANVANAFSDFPLDKIYSTPSVTFVSNKWLHEVVAFIVHNVPACFFDLALIISGRKPRLFRLARRMKSNVDVLEYFLTHNFMWKIDNVNKLRDEMTPQDRMNFDFNTSSIDWNHYMAVYARGTKEFLLKEDLKGYPAARRHLQRLRYMGYGLQILMFMIVWRLIVPTSSIGKNSWHLFISLWFKFIRFFQISSTIHPRSFVARFLS